MSKRSSSSAAGSPRKRSKPSGQPRLDTFFSSPKKQLRDALDGDAKRGNTSNTKSRPVARSGPVEVIDVDELQESTTSDTVADPSIPVAAVVSGPSSPKPSTSSQKTGLQSFYFSAALPDQSQLGYPDLLQDPLTCGVAKTKPWQLKRTPYSFLAHILQTLSATSSRIAIINTLTNGVTTICRHDPPSLIPTLYLLSNSLAPPYVAVELGIGPAVISKAVQHVGGLTPSALKKLYIRTGDMGDVAFEAKSKLSTLVPHDPLSVAVVYDTLLKISAARGSGAAKQKQQLVEKLLVSAKGEEIRFLVRTLSLNLRVGAVKASILTALARAMVLTPPGTENFQVPESSEYHVEESLLSRVLPISSNSKKKEVDLARDEVVAQFSKAEALVKRVFVKHPSYDDIVSKGLLLGGLDSLEARVPLSVGIPLNPTLGTPTRSLEEVFSTVGDAAFAAEFKYDGQRAQIHASKGADGMVSVKIFSRHLEDMTSKYPDIVSLVKSQLESTPHITSFIMDSEIVAVDPLNGELKSFQELSNRARKDVQLKDVRVAVAVFAFDLMYLNGDILLDSPFRRRRELLRSQFHPTVRDQGDLDHAQFGFVENCDSDESSDAIEQFWARALESRCEGLMVKVLDTVVSIETDGIGKKKRKIAATAKYEADKRTSSWLKLKKDYVDGLGDSLDLVPIGGWYGNGRKAKWWSPVLLGIRDPETGALFALCKCMSGFSDSFYQQMKDLYGEDSDNCSPNPLWGGTFGGFRPSVYFRPHEVWEIRGADITISPVSLAGRGAVSSDRGLSLRFPRFIKSREDKSIDQASSFELLVKMWNSQQQGPKEGIGGADEGDLVDIDLDELACEEDSDTDEDEEGV